MIVSTTVLYTTVLLRLTHKSSVKDKPKMFSKSFVSYPDRILKNLKSIVTDNRHRHRLTWFIPHTVTSRF